MPVGGVRVGLEAIAAHVEPYRRVESRLLLDQDVHQLIVKRGRVFGAAEVSAGHAPVANRLSYPAHQCAHAALALGRPHGAVQVFAGDNVGRRHRPVFRRLDVLLLEDHPALRVGDGRRAQLPLDLVIGRDSRLGKEAAEGEAGKLLLVEGRGISRGRRFSRMVFRCMILSRTVSEGTLDNMFGRFVGEWGHLR